MATYQTIDGLVVARPEDLLYLQVVLHDGDLRLVFGPQHVMEYPAEAPWPDSAPLSEWEVTPAVSTAAGTTYLVFPFDTAIAADLGDHLLELVERGDSFDGRIEFVTTLPMEPYGPSRWRLDPGPRTGDGWTAVWQARLFETSGSLPGVDGPLLQVVDEDEALGTEAGAYDVLPFATFPRLRGALFRTELALSTLGASGRIRGPHWPDGTTDPGTVKSYDHKTQFGRDQQWTQVVRGHLSSGHPAELQVVTSRVFARRLTAPETRPGEPPPTGFRETYYGARLFSTATLTVVDPVAYPEGTTPFRSLRITPEVLKVDFGASSAFWVTRGWMDIAFSLVATDWDGREIPFTVPLMFIIDGLDHAGADVTATFNAGGPQYAARREIDLGGQAVTLADSSARADIATSDVTLPVHRITLKLGATIVPDTVAVTLDAVSRLSGVSAPVACRLAADGIGPTGNFLKIEDPAFRNPIDFAADKVGGLASPNARLDVVSATKGVIPSPDAPVADTFSNALLLGVPLVSLLADAIDTPDTPPILRSAKLPDAIVTSYDWSPALTVDPPDADKVIRVNAGATLRLHASVTQPLVLAAPPPTPTSRAEGWLTNVTLSLLGLIEVTFGEVHFLDAPDTTPNVSASGVAVAFKGDLAFVSALAEEIGDFNPGTPVTVNSSGITASYTLALPSVAFGVFSLTNVSLGAEVRIPFNDKPPSVRFNFAERHSPFGLSVGIFGGGGFFAITATTDAIERIEGSLEFGGVFEVNVGVAAGGVFAKGGVSLLRTDDNVNVDGYLRCGGHLEILEVVGVSLEFEMVLGYRSDPGEIHGRATLTVGIHVLFFNESVTFSVERSFSTSSAHDAAPGPGLTEADWEQYGAAFA